MLHKGVLSLSQAWKLCDEFIKSAKLSVLITTCSLIWLLGHKSCIPSISNTNPVQPGVVTITGQIEDYDRSNNKGMLVFFNALTRSQQTELVQLDSTGSFIVSIHLAHPSKSDFEWHTGPVVRFPTYIIVDGSGKVVESKAYFPIQGKKLYSQIIEKLKL